MLRTIVFAALLALTGCGMGAKNDLQPLQQGSVSMDPSQWYLFYSEGFKNPRGGEAPVVLDLPNQPGHVNYFLTPFRSNGTPHTLTITFRMKATNAAYNSLEHDAASFRVFFERREDDLKHENWRWWSNAGKYDLGTRDGDLITFTIPMNPDVWTNVNGQHNDSGFYDCLANVAWVGITWGGQSTAGHGVNLTAGSAEFQLVDYKLE